MKRLILPMLVGLIGLTACSNDDDKDKIKLNKMTKVTCYKNNEVTPLFQVEITYNTTDGTISHLQSSDKGKLVYIYTDNLLTISGTDSERTEYTLSNNFIREKKTYTTNPYANNAAYVNEEYTYTYKRDKLSSADKLLRWPLENGTQYETRQYTGYDNYTWTGNNLTMFTQETKEMVYEYTAYECPENLPFIVTNSFNPVSFETFDPVNFYYGALNKQLVSRAYWYNVPEASINAEYLFDYKFHNEYVNTITIEEKNHLAEGGYNTYTINFEYNYQVK